MKKIVVFASGNGSNFQRIVDFFEKDKEVEVVLLVSNKQDAYVLERAKKTKIPSLVITREMLYQTEDVVRILEKIQPDLLVLAGFVVNSGKYDSCFSSQSYYSSGTFAKIWRQRHVRHECSQGGS